MNQKLLSLLTVSITAGVTFSLLLAVAGPPKVPSDMPSSAVVTPRAGRMDHLIPKLDAVNTPLADLVDRIANEAGLIVDPTWKKPLTDALPAVTIHLNTITAGSALTAVLAHAEDLHWYEKAGVVHIAPKEILGTHEPILRMYDIRPLLAKERAATHAWITARENIADESDMDHTRDFAGLLTSMIDPVSWKDNGGDVGTICTMPGLMLIAQTAPNQDAIVRLMTTLMRKAHD